MLTQPPRASLRCLVARLLAFAACTCALPAQLVDWEAVLTSSAGSATFTAVEARGDNGTGGSEILVAGHFTGSLSLGRAHLWGGCHPLEHESLAHPCTPRNRTRRRHSSRRSTPPTFTKSNCSRPSPICTPSQEPGGRSKCSNAIKLQDHKFSKTNKHTNCNFVK
jgi:hypothetical protein